MKPLTVLLLVAALGGCAGPAPQAHRPPHPEQVESGNRAVAACKSAVALRTGANPVFVLPISHVPAAGGFEVFLSLNSHQWLCTTDPYGNVGMLERR